MNNQENEILETLRSIDQNEIIKHYQNFNEEQKRKFIEQIIFINSAYPGGITEYYNKGKKLLLERKNKVNKLADYDIEQPKGVKLEIGSKEFYEMDEKGFDLIKDTCFLLVAGGLGERLGYDDIKIKIKTELITERSFIEVYIDYIKAYEDRLKKKFKDLDENWYIPFCIMTSDDTNEKTVEFLKLHNNFGLKENQIEIIKQEKLPTFIDNDAHFNLDLKTCLLETKPHGHGDVHRLLYEKGIIKKWIKNNKKYFIIFQDTNGLVFNSFPSGLGVSEKHNMSINYLCVKMRPEDAISEIIKLNHKTINGKTIIKNVFYNDLKGLAEGKNIKDKDGYSIFPAIMNAVIYNLKDYQRDLEKMKGMTPELISPKYTDETRTKFRSSARIECQLQDFQDFLDNFEGISYTQYYKWFCFSTVKNNIKDGVALYKKDIISEACFCMEKDIFNYNVISLDKIFDKLTIIETEAANEVKILDIKIKFGPKIVIYPSFAASYSEFRDKIAKIKGKIKITNNSSLIIKNDINIEGEINIDGNCIIDKDSKDDIICNNKQRYNYIEISENEKSVDSKIRGYKL